MKYHAGQTNCTKAKIISERMKGGFILEKEKIKEIPIWEKQNLKLDECCIYANIGKNRLEELMKNSDSNFWFFVGNRRLINRKLFDDYIQKIAEVNGSL